MQERNIFKKNKRIVFISIYFFSLKVLFCDYPEITSLTFDDVLYHQIEEDISSYYVAVAQGKPELLPPLMLFQYKKDDNEDLFSIASRLNLPYETLATLNRASNLESFNNLETILITNLPGLFIPLNPENELEQLMLSWRDTGTSGSEKIVLERGNIKNDVVFLIGERFHPIERAYFLRVLFRFPIPDGIVVSGFGYRDNPITGKIHFHSGIDIAAPLGTDIIAAADGIASEIGYNEQYGIYIVISHDGGYQTLYGHLSEVLVELNQRVISTMIIGKVGLTGLTTGPHLHFEIRRGGECKDPLELFLE